MLFVKPSVWVGLATQTSLLSTTITMLAAPLGALLGALLIEHLGRRIEVAGGLSGSPSSRFCTRWRSAPATRW